MSAFAQLDYLYTPSRDVAHDAQSFADRLGAEIAFSVEGMGARVAMLRLTAQGPHILLTDHLDGELPIHVYRVENLRKAVAELRKRGLKKKRSLELPMGSCVSFVMPSGHRVAVYEESRPGVLEHFLGRRDF